MKHLIYRVLSYIMKHRYIQIILLIAAAMDIAAWLYLIIKINT